MEGNEKPYTTIVIKKVARMKLERIKTHPRQSYSDVVDLLIQYYETHPQEIAANAVIQPKPTEPLIIVGEKKDVPG